MRAVVRTARGFLRLLRAFARLEFSPVLPPGSALRSAHSDAARLRRLVTGLGGDPSSAWVRLVRVAVALWWPIRAVVGALLCVLRHGRVAASSGGPSRARQLRRSLVLAARWNLAPVTTYLYRLWDGDPDGFVQTDEMGVLQEISRRGGVDPRHLTDKARFADDCREAALPVATTVGTAARGRIQWRDGRPPPCDLFAKPVWGEQGRGVERWTFDAGTTTWSRGDHRLDAAALTAHLRRRGWWRTLLVQEALRNHPDLDRFGTDALCTFRVVTYRGDDEVPRVLAAILKLAAPGAEVDNLHAGGLVAGVDLATGTLLPARTREPGAPPHDVHPTTGAAIAGSPVPLAAAAVDLALRAHATLVTPWSVGWDVAVTAGGPVLVEGNAGWGVDLYHVPMARPLPEDFLAHLVAHLGA